MGRKDINFSEDSSIDSKSFINVQRYQSKLKKKRFSMLQRIIFIPIHSRKKLHTVSKALEQEQVQYESEKRVSKGERRKKNRKSWQMCSLTCQVQWLEN